MIADDLNTCSSQTWKSNVCKATGLKHKFNIAAHLKNTDTTKRSLQNNQTNINSAVNPASTVIFRFEYHNFCKIKVNF